jgi:hypothetical protein
MHYQHPELEVVRATLDFGFVLVDQPKTASDLLSFDGCYGRRFEWCRDSSARGRLKKARQRFCEYTRGITTPRPVKGVHSSAQFCHLASETAFSFFHRPLFCCIQVQA